MTEIPSERARELRENSTDAEHRRWSALRDRRLRGYRFRRQHPIGEFIVDFACTRHSLVVEADGGQHAENEADRRRPAWLAAEGGRGLPFLHDWSPARPCGVIQ